MKYSTAIIPVFAVASLAASIKTRQSNKLPWQTPTTINLIACGDARPIDEYTCGTDQFCNLINDPRMDPCHNPQGWKSPQECLDAHEAKPSKEKCTKLRSDAVDECREKSKSQECGTKGQDVFDTCIGIQKPPSREEEIAEWRAKGCEDWSR